MNKQKNYRIELIDRNGVHQRDHILAESAQEAADKIRADWKDCYILRISVVVYDWR